MWIGRSARPLTSTLGSASLPSAQRERRGSHACSAPARLGSALLCSDLRPPCTLRVVLLCEPLQPRYRSVSTATTPPSPTPSNAERPAAVGKNGRRAAWETRGGDGLTSNFAAQLHSSVSGSVASSRQDSFKVRAEEKERRAAAAGLSGFHSVKRPLFCLFFHPLSTTTTTTMA